MLLCRLQTRDSATTETSELLEPSTLVDDRNIFTANLCSLAAPVASVTRSYRRAVVLA